jgi:hypothetical protein
MDNFPTISHVTPLPHYTLLVTFINGITKKYDCLPLLKRPEFLLLKNEAFFKSVRVDGGGYGISWNDDIDISEYELWTNGIETILPRSLQQNT